VIDHCSMSNRLKQEEACERERVPSKTLDE